MKRTLLALALLASSLSPALAGIADSPLPVLLVGSGTLHLYSVPGVINALGIGTLFSCTSTATSPIQVGVEVFGFAGGAPLNNAAAQSVSLAPGASVRFGTTSIGGLAVTTSLSIPVFAHGSARILSTSKSLICDAFLSDVANSPPTSMTQLTIVAKLKQKAAN